MSDLSAAAFQAGVELRNRLTRTDIANVANLTEAVKFVYSYMEMEPPQIIRVTSPLMAQIVLTQLSNDGNLGLSVESAPAKLLYRVSASSRRAVLSARVHLTLGVQDQFFRFDDALDEELYSKRLHFHAPYRLIDHPDDIRYDMVNEIIAQIPHKREINEFTEIDSFSGEIGGPALLGHLVLSIFAQRYIHKYFTDEEFAYLLQLQQIVNNCMYAHLYTKACVVIDFPTKVHLDDAGLLHKSDGAAVRFVDNFRIHFWHGRHIPPRYIERPITVGLIDIEGNLESKRIMIEIMGYARYLKESGATLLSEDAYGRLFTFPGDGQRLMVEVVNGTPAENGGEKLYVLPVPVINELTRRRMRTAHEAVAWSYGLLPEQYKPIIRT